MPEVVATDSRGYKSLEYGNLAVLLIEAVKEQQAQIDEQNARIEELTQRAGMPAT